MHNCNPPNMLRILNQDWGGEHITCIGGGGKENRIVVKKSEEEIVPDTTGHR
jgi:hypothetical protein